MFFPSARHYAKFTSWIGLIAVAALFLGCGSTQAVQKNPGGQSDSPTDEAGDAQEEVRKDRVESDRPEPERVLRTDAVRAQLERAADGWYGVPYKWGGTTKDGVDCSALVQNVYKGAFGRKLPRVTDEQVQTGTRIPRSKLRPGDLVFFRPNNEYNHVGIYLGEGTFVHASSSKGVRNSPIEKNYWDDAYWTSRRTLQTSNVPDSLTSDLIAYQYPDTTASTPIAEEETQQSAPSDTTRIASCGTAGVDCVDRSSSKDAEQGSSGSSTSEGRERKGW